jgi:5-methyltetrahydrofolate--homocysteine methyltransferase
VNRLTALLGESTPVVVDGGMGTLLQDRGLTDGGAGELWNVERPEVVRDSHDAYARACSPPTPSAAPGPGCRCTASRTGCTS